MPPRKSPASFVERHNLWTAAQAKAAADIERAIDDILKAYATATLVDERARGEWIALAFRTPA